VSRRAVWEADDAKAGQGVASAAEDYAAYLDGEPAAHLRTCLFWLEER
jgi:hypothetical protein